MRSCTSNSARAVSRTWASGGGAGSADRWPAVAPLGSFIVSFWGSASRSSFYRSAIRVRGSGSSPRTTTTRSPPRTIISSPTIRRPPAPVTRPGWGAPRHGPCVRDVGAVAREVTVPVADVALVVAGGTWGEMFAWSTSPLYRHPLSFNSFWPVKLLHGIVRISVTVELEEAVSECRPVPRFPYLSIFVEIFLYLFLVVINPQISNVQKRHFSGSIEKGQVVSKNDTTYLI